MANCVTASPQPSIQHHELIVFQFEGSNPSHIDLWSATLTVPAEEIEAEILGRLAAQIGAKSSVLAFARIRPKP